MNTHSVHTGKVLVAMVGEKFDEDKAMSLSNLAILK